MKFSICPKCGHKPLPEDQSSPAACPACGLILAKFNAAPVSTAAERPPGSAALAPATPGLARSRRAPSGGDDDNPGWLQRAAQWLLHVPQEVSRTNWYARTATLAVFILWTGFIWRDIDIPAAEYGSNFLHAVLLPFHEAGHYLIFRWFGQFIMILGGTLGQLLMPMVVGGALLIQRRDPFGAALFFWLLGFSVADMGLYMYDAYDPKMGLIGGGTGQDRDSHDWQNLFGDMGLIHCARGIGTFFGWVGEAMMLAGLAWAAWMLWLQYQRLSDSPFAEERQD